MPKFNILFVILIFALFASACQIPNKNTISTESAKRQDTFIKVELGKIEGVIVPIQLAPKILKQCSRSTLGLGEGYWIPSVNQLRVLEEKLSEHFMPEDLSIFKRQYAGIIRNSKKTIYVNMFLESFITKNWKQEVMLVCDGGSSYFGVEVSLETNEILHIDFNGDEPPRE